MARKYTKRKFRKGRTKKRSSKKISFKKKVQAIINKNEEDKEAFTSLSTTGFNSGMNSSGDIMYIVPNVAQGVLENQRIGNQISAKSISVKGAIVWAPSIGTFGTYANARLGVRIIICQPKAYNTYEAIFANFSTWQNTLLRRGGTTVAFTGIMADLWSPINTDAITKYHDKIYYLNGSYAATNAGYSQLLGSTKMFSYRKTWKNGKILKYDPSVNSGISATNFAPVMMLGYVHMDGSGPDTASTAVNFQWDSVFNYQDA